MYGENTLITKELNNHEDMNVMNPIILALKTIVKRFMKKHTSKQSQEQYAPKPFTQQLL